MWVLCAPGGITGFDYVLVGLAALLDISTLAGGGRSYSERGASAAPVS